MTGYQSKKTLRHADDVTLSHLIDLRKLEAENERLREALHAILCNTDPHAIRHRDYDHLAKNIFDCASAALKEKE